MRTDVGGQEYLVKRRHEVVDTLHVPTCGVPDGPDIQYPLQALGMEEVRVRMLSCTMRWRRRLPVVSPPASTAVPQVESLAHQSQSGARFVDRVLLFPGQMRVPPERRTLLAFEPTSLHASETAKVDNPVHV